MPITCPCPHKVRFLVTAQPEPLLRAEPLSPSLTADREAGSTCARWARIVPIADRAQCLLHPHHHSLRRIHRRRHPYPHRIRSIRPLRPFHRSTRWSVSRHLLYSSRSHSPSAACSVPVRRCSAPVRRCCLPHSSAVCRRAFSLFAIALTTHGAPSTLTHPRWRAAPICSFQRGAIGSRSTRRELPA